MEMLEFDFWLVACYLFLFFFWFPNRCGRVRGGGLVRSAVHQHERLVQLRLRRRLPQGRPAMPRRQRCVRLLFFFPFGCFFLFLFGFSRLRSCVVVCWFRFFGPLLEFFNSFFLKREACWKLCGGFVLRVRWPVVFIWKNRPFDRFFGRFVSSTLFFLRESVKNEFLSSFDCDQHV